jgi:cytochrome c oxidase cbb3-type subunit III
MEPMRDVSRIGLALAGALAVVACDRSRPPPFETAVLQPIGEAYAVGPEPGPDHPEPEAANPYAGHREVLPEGRRLFVWYNCAGCHGDHAGGGMGPSLRDGDWIYGSSDAAIFASITEGRTKGMPSWGGKLPADQIWKIVTYIKSMRTPDEPDPPR